jgi:hypothetical protein
MKPFKYNLLIVFNLLVNKVYALGHANWLVASKNYPITETCNLARSLFQMILLNAVDNKTMDMWRHKCMSFG